MSHKFKIGDIVVVCDPILDDILGKKGIIIRNRRLNEDFYFVELFFNKTFGYYLNDDEIKLDTDFMIERAINEVLDE